MATIRKRVLPSGKTVWQCDYQDASGKRRHKQFEKKKDADCFMVKARSEVAAGVHTPDSISITVKDAAAMWIERCERDQLERTTLRQYLTHVRLHILPFIGGVKLSRLSTPAVNGYVDQLLASGRSHEMARRVLRSLSSIVTEAQRRGLVAANGVREASPVKKARRDDTRPSMPTRAELKAIIDHTPDKWRPLILTAIFTGLRGSELRGLKWEDVDLKAGVLQVRRRVDRFNAFGPPKSDAGVRDILTPVLMTTLKAWRLACPIGDLDLVFPTGTGRVESHGNILRRVFWPIQIEAGVTVLEETQGALGRAVKLPRAKHSLHALRHAAAALWIEQGLSPKRIQALMGHASITQTFDTYGYLLEARDDVKAAMAGVEIGLVR